MRHKLCLTLMLVMATYARGQNAHTVVIASKSEASPSVRLTGEVTIEEKADAAKTSSTYHEHIVGTNSSDKTILALVTVLDISGAQGALITQENILDSFFGHQEIAPGKQFVHREHGNAPQMSGPPLRGKPLAPHAEASLIYVQFTDGTTQGNAQHPAAKAMLKHRANLLEAYQRMDRASYQGEQAFLREVAVKLDDLYADGTVENEVRQFQKEKGTAAAIAYVREMLETATKHTKGLRPSVP